VAAGAYRVFGCDGFAANVVIIAAAELAYQDGMDIINLCAADKQNAVARASASKARTGFESLKVPLELKGSC